MLDIMKLGEEVLREKCTPVTEFDDALRILIQAMYETMEEADGIGLAAPQVGVDKRFFVVGLPDGTKKEFINPQITGTSVETSPYEEGCLSLPNVYHEVIRPSKVIISAQDMNGNPFTLKASGLMARVIQHEYDHLDGVLFIDHLSDEEKSKVVRAYEKKNRRNRHK
ncbi:MAG: peptide deformylase [Spirochaetales bacterium]|nr:peptide deformylase [Spirochaetales bacterium]MBO6049022.1 peptide deformylase [Spirochaetales bacterium]MBO7349857.1 peptide deformylase [Spirochaetales bacterium]MBP5756689.1 peptide deformylase [Spirochaetales bacterium]